MSLDWEFGGKLEGVWREIGGGFEGRLEGVWREVGGGLEGGLGRF